VTACGASCKSVCEDKKKCAGEDKNRNCDQFCDDRERVTDNAKCSDLYEKYGDCEGDKDDVCRADDHTCDAEYNALMTCVLPYCMAHSSECSSAAFTN